MLQTHAELQGSSDADQRHRDCDVTKLLWTCIGGWGGGEGEREGSQGRAVRGGREGGREGGGRGGGREGGRAVRGGEGLL